MNEWVRQCQNKNHNLPFDWCWTVVRFSHWSEHSNELYYSFPFNWCVIQCRWCEIMDLLLSEGLLSYTCSMDIHFTHFAGNLCISFADCHTNQDRCIPNTPCVFMFLFTLISLFSTPLAPHTDAAQVFSPTFIHYLHVVTSAMCMLYDSLNFQWMYVEKFCL